MNAARQILRYSIPGSLLVLNGIACYLIFRRCQGVPFATSSTVLDENVGALVAILATIPIGFVVYQAYYFSYLPLIRAWPRKWQGRLIRPDRGSEILCVLQPSQIMASSAIFGLPLDVSQPHRPVQRSQRRLGKPAQKVMARLGILELTPGRHQRFPEKEQRGRAYADRWHANWNVVRAILDIASSTKGGRPIKDEYTTLSDIYHALGAARTALTFAWAGVAVLGVLHVGRLVDHPIGSLCGLLAITGLTLTLNVILHLARVRTWQTAATSLRLGLRWFFWLHVDDFVLKRGVPEDDWVKRALRSEVPATG